MKSFISSLSAGILVATIVLGASPQISDAFSYSLREGLPSHLSATFKTEPNRPLRPGERFSFIVIVTNSSNQAATDVDVSIWTNLAPRLELRRVEPHPHLLNYIEEEKKYYDVAWENQTIPAKGSKRYVVSYRLDPAFETIKPKNTSDALNNRETISLSIRAAGTGRSLWFNDILPIDSAKGDQSPRHDSIIDNIFYAAYQRFPSKAEATKWSKEYDRISKDGRPCIGTQTCNRGSYLLHLMRKEAAKATAKATPRGSLASISDLNSLFRGVHGRNPTSAEWHYWANRLLDKPDRTAFVGAMYYHKARGRTTGD